MKFDEAMKALKEGKDVTRKQWFGSILFRQVQDDKGVDKLLSLMPVLKPFSYESDIMTSSGWQLIDSDEDYYFYDVISFLLDGKKIKHKYWFKGNYIYYNNQDKYIMKYELENHPYMPDFESFVADDWVML